MRYAVVPSANYVSSTAMTAERFGYLRNITLDLRLNLKSTSSIPAQGRIDDGYITVAINTSPTSGSRIIGDETIVDK